jgi:hypothetical protein
MKQIQFIIETEEQAKEYGYPIGTWMAKIELSNITEEDIKNLNETSTLKLKN